MNLQDLNKIIHSNLRTASLIKNNLSDELLIIENKNIGLTGKLKSVKLINTPTDFCWIFEHEDSNKELRAEAKKVEKSILLLREDKKELNIILIEMKSTFRNEHLIDCVDKTNCSLSYLTIFLATNNHMLEKYKNYKIKFRLVVFCNNEVINISNPTISENICQSFLEYRNGNTDKFKVEIISPNLGYKIIPAICIHENSEENIEMDFSNLLIQLGL